MEGLVDGSRWKSADLGRIDRMLFYRWKSLALALILVAVCPIAAVNGEESSSSASGRQLSMQSDFGDFVVPPGRRLGIFAIDLGLSVSSDSEAVKTQYIMERIFASAVGDKVDRISDAECHLVLMTGYYYPFLLGYLYRGSQANSEAALRGRCLEYFKIAFDSIEQDERAILGAVHECIRALRPSRVVAGEAMTLKYPFLAADDGIGEFEKRVYADNTPMHALLNIGPEDYDRVSIDAFRSWIKQIRAANRVHFISENAQIQESLDPSYHNGTPMLPEITASKKPTRRIQLTHFDLPAIRAAVLVALDYLKGNQLRDEVIARTCRERPGENTKPSPRNQAAPMRPHCVTDNVYGREFWFAMYFGADDGSDEELSRKVEELAEDPIIKNLAAQKREGSEPGQPYVVLFGPR
jgi:hypothetical protein